MKRTGLVIAAMAAASSMRGSSALAQAPILKPELAGIAFLAGDWSGGRGKVADTGQTSTGSSRFEPAANGAVLLRRDRTELFDAAGKPAGGFDQVMMIYGEGATLHADYSDGDHVIHYTSASVVAGRSVTFTSAEVAGTPTFQLAYTLSAPRTLEVSFAMAPPGGAGFHPIATGTLTRSN